MTYTSNPQLELAFDFLENTNRNIFLTGKAGTGKTTFLHQLKEKSLKRMAVVAPTGVAAINAKGVTIHSLFQLPFGPFLPGSKNDLNRNRKFSQKKINLLKSLDLLVIDEISMVRSDLLDGIDSVLRRYKDRAKPFGGVQLLMIGDLHQLPPVVKDTEWHLLRDYYKTPYFFGSLSLQESYPITIELKHIYRQSDEDFIRLLNKVRDNQMDEEVLSLLNSRYVADFQPTNKEAYIILTSHNKTANSINKEKLELLKDKLHTFKAIVEGNFPEHSYPTSEILSFKVGAQVLFVKNDISQEKRYYNGKIGQIIKIGKDTITVKCPDDPETILVSKVDWTNRKYSLNASTKEVTEEEVGTFTQFPLKLAWAITIHKSQGLTFERAVIDAQSAFAHGQVYVALSRCKTFEGIVLRSKLESRSVKTDSVVKNYTEESEKNAPTEKDLYQSKKDYQQSLIRELFDFKKLQYGFQGLMRVYMEHENTLTTAALSQVNNLAEAAEKTVIAVGDKFQRQLSTYFQNEALPEENEELLERLKKASVYFYNQIDTSLLPDFKKIPILTDNQAVKKKATQNLKRVQKELLIKKACYKLTTTSFTVSGYVTTRANADIDTEKSKTTSKSRAYRAPSDTPHPDLYEKLTKWRRAISVQKEINAFQILSTKSIIELCHVLPTNSATLKSIKGVGDQKVKEYGIAILDIVEEYIEAKGITGNQPAPPPPPLVKPQKGSTKEISFDMFNAGKDILEIATARALTEGTIIGHLGHYVAMGELDIFKIMDAAKVTELETFFAANPNLTFSESKAKLADKFSYQDMKLVTSYIRRKEENKV